VNSDDGLRERALGAYLGLAIGDALGAPVEFMTAREIAARHGVLREMCGGGWLKLKPGQITDDTEMSLIIGRALIAGSGFNLHAIAEGFSAWLKGRPIDVGNTCRRGIRRYMHDGSLEGPLSEGDAGNGACMRNVAVVLATLNDSDAFERCTLQQCRLTHHHPLSDSATLAFGHMARTLIRGGTLAACQQFADELVRNHRVFRYVPYPKRASAYIVDTVQTVLHYFFTSEDFESCLVGVINQGEDADTTAALAGMLAGARFGVQGIPARWRKALDARVSGEITSQVDGLLELARRAPSPR
jgi:ADP-ribosyl-[dinitrogen reductase] hydrolase